MENTLEEPKAIVPEEDSAEGGADEELINRKYLTVKDYIFLYRAIYCFTIRSA